MPAPRFIPRLMSAPAAAAYLAVGETTLRSLPIPRRILGGKRVYHVTDLDAYADSLPVEGEAESGCDDIFEAGASV